MRNRLRSRRPCLRAFLLVAVSVAVLAGGATPAAAASASSVPAAPERPSNLTPATEAQIRNAEPLRPLLTGVSKREPPLCEGQTAPSYENQPNTVLREGAFSVSPASYEFAGAVPGTTYVACAVVHNRNLEPRRYTLRSIELVGSRDPDEQQVVVEEPTALGSWIHPVITSFQLKPGQRIFVPYTIEIPEAVPTGTLVAALQVEQDPIEHEVTGAVIRGAVSQRVVLTAPGGKRGPIKVTGVEAPRILSHDDDPIAYHVKFVVTNEGTDYARYDVRLDVSGFGRRVGGAEVPSAAILPDGANRVKLSWRGLPWIGWYRPTATVRSDAGDVDVPLPSLFILPKRPYLIAILVAVLLPLVAAVVRWRRRRAEWRAYLEEPDEDEDSAAGYDEDPRSGW